jgi:hypothetical protein
MEVQIKKDGASLGRGRMAECELGEEEGPGTAIRLHGASPKTRDLTPDTGASGTVRMSLTSTDFKLFSTPSR